MDLISLIYLLVTLWVSYKIYVWVVFFYKRSQNKKKEQAVKERRASKVFKFDPVDSKLKDIILKSSIQQLVDGQFQKRFTSYQIVTVFSERAYRIGRKLWLTADECFEEALEMAKEKDKQLNQCLLSKKDPYKGTWASICRCFNQMKSSLSYIF